MERSWSREAEAILGAYPWKNAADRLRARAEAELVAFGEEVEPEDLPLAVRRWARENRPPRRRARCGEGLSEAVAALEKDMIGEALRAAGGNAAAAARALKTTPRIVRYKAARYGLAGTE